MPEQTIFKTTLFGGFNKDDVLKYIDSMAKKYSEEEKENQQLLDEKEKAVSDALNELSEKEESLKELDEVVAKLRGVLAKTQSELEIAKEEGEALRRDLALSIERCEKMEKELAIVSEQNKLQAEDIEEKNNKLSQYDAMAKQWGDSIDVAKTKAKEIVSDTKDEILSMTFEAQRNTEQVNNELTELQGELTKLKEYTEKSMAELVKRMDNIGANADKMKLETPIRESRSEMQNRFEELSASVDDNMDKFKDSFFRTAAV